MQKPLLDKADAMDWIDAHGRTRALARVSTDHSTDTFQSLVHQMKV